MERVFTPGPWSVDPHLRVEKTHWHPNYTTAFVRVGEGSTAGNPIATVSLGGKGAIVSNQESVLANANLIAASPDLYEALEEIRNAILGPDGPNGRNLWAIPIVAEQKMRDALAKARGEKV